MHRRYGQIAIGVAIVGVAAGGTTAAVAWTDNGGSGSSSVTTSDDTRPASVLGLQTAKPSPPTSVTPPVPATTTPATPSPTATAPVPLAPKPPITYVVKRGDNLSVIAWWFQVHGYGAIYEANKSVIGDNPNLIYAGQRLTIANGHLTMSSP
jgi:nucleoid-associated protein YgaU